MPLILLLAALQAFWDSVLGTPTRRPRLAVIKGGAQGERKGGQCSRQTLLVMFLAALKRVWAAFDSLWAALGRLGGS